MAELQIKADNFEKEVLQSDLPVLVDFYSDWCPPCKMLAPIIEGLAEEWAGKVKVGKLNVDQNQPLASQYGVMSIPTLIFFKDGREVKRMVGLRGKEEIAGELNQLI